MDTIVVGIDGSAPAQRALELAAHEATLRGARLRILSVWQVPPAVYGAAFAPAPDQAALDAFREHAETVVREALDTITKLHPDLQAEGATPQGQPAASLLAEAKDAAMIVVGNRGHGGFSSLLLGSVSQQIVHHATCPVLVVPHGR